MLRVLLATALGALTTAQIGPHGIGTSFVEQRAVKALQDVKRITEAREMRRAAGPHSSLVELGAGEIPTLDKTLDEIENPTPADMRLQAKKAIATGATEEASLRAEIRAVDPAEEEDAKEILVDAKKSLLGDDLSGMPVGLSDGAQGFHDALEQQLSGRHLDAGNQKLMAILEGGKHALADIDEHAEDVQKNILSHLPDPYHPGRKAPTLDALASSFLQAPATAYQAAGGTAGNPSALVEQQIDHEMQGTRAILDNYMKKEQAEIDGFQAPGMSVGGAIAKASKEFPLSEFPSSFLEKEQLPSYDELDARLKRLEAGVSSHLAELQGEKPAAPSSLLEKERLPSYDELDARLKRLEAGVSSHLAELQGEKPAAPSSLAEVEAQPVGSAIEQKINEAFQHGLQKGFSTVQNSVQDKAEAEKKRREEKQAERAARILMKEQEKEAVHSIEADGEQGANDEVEDYASSHDGEDPLE